MTGRLGHGTDEDCLFPKRMEFWDQVPSKVVKVSGRGGHYVAMTEKGDVYTGGYGGQGRLGHYNEHDQTLPKRVEFFNGKKAVSFTTGIDFSVIVVEKE